MKLIQYPKVVTTLSLVFSGIASAVPLGLVEGLGDESYQLREKAEQDLTLWAKKEGEKGLDELSALKKKSQSPEVKSRLDNVISGVTVYKAIPGTQGFMGISMQAAMGCSVITSVSPDTPAAKSGLQPFDKIIELDGVDLSKKNNHADEATDFLRRYVKSKKSGEKLTIKIDRDGTTLTKTLKLADYDKQMARLGVRQERMLDPFGGAGGFGGGIQILPMQGGGIQRRLKIIPRRGKNDINPKLQLELKQKKLEQLLNNPAVPDEFKEMLKQQDDEMKKKLDQFKKELNLKLKEKKNLEK